MKKEVTLLSPGPSRKQCRFETEELWGVSRLLLEDDLKDKKFTKVFCMDGEFQCINDHPPMRMESIRNSIDKAAKLNIPLVSLAEYATELYPIRKIVARFKTTYFGPTVTWMIAYALYYGYEKLFIYGIDQGPELMYQTGKPAVTFWLGIASALGVELVMGRGSLRWTYNPGLDNFPIAWVKEEYEKIYWATVGNKEDKDEC